MPRAGKRGSFRGCLKGGLEKSLLNDLGCRMNFKPFFENIFNFALSNIFWKIKVENCRNTKFSDYLFYEIQVNLRSNQENWG